MRRVAGCRSVGERGSEQGDPGVGWGGEGRSRGQGVGGWLGVEQEAESRVQGQRAFQGPISTSEKSTYEKENFAAKQWGGGG